MRTQCNVTTQTLSTYAVSAPLSIADIVERLPEAESGIKLEAANEIERLRAALQALVDAKDNSELMRARVAAHAALMKEQP